MACASPIVVKHPKKGFVRVPCGFCRLCRISRQSEWSARLRFEQIKSERLGYGNAFVLLSYDDEHLPPGGVFKRDCQLFLKRLRRNIDYYDVYHRPDFKYFLVSEYGDNTGRPHYHVLFFGIDFTSAVFRQSWSLGFVSPRPILSGGIRYVLKYLEKCQPAPTERAIYSRLGLQVPFRLMSKGLGSELYSSDSAKAFSYYYRNKFLVPYDDSLRWRKDIELRSAELYNMSVADYRRLINGIRNNSALSKARLYGEIV